MRAVVPSHLLGLTTLLMGERSGVTINDAYAWFFVAARSVHGMPISELPKDSFPAMI
jgi:hypothetical protein